MEQSRNQQNYVIMTVVYDELTDYVCSEGKTFRDAKELIAELCEQPYELVSDYIKISVASCLNNYGAIKEAYEPHLKNWKWDRLPLLTQAILLMSYAHFYYVEKIEKRIVISIAVDLAKKYVEEKQGKFVHAILDEVLK
ncbi:MAG: hypothetical protein MJ248_05905 [Bacilli bacterium]|nr:hypothetical protein [Bacilli bacterium]